MAQERMHHEDARREMAMRVWDCCSTDMEVEHAVQWAVEVADAILAELDRTAKPEAEPIHVGMAATPESNPDYRVRLETERADKAEADLRTARENLKKADDRWANEQEVSARHLAKTIILDARVKELEDEIRRHQISFPSLVRPSKADARLWELVK